MDKFGHSQKIVIVEDNGSLAEIYKTRMEILGYEVKVAFDGVAALNLIKAEMPDLVLLDLMVPKIAGDQILETMRKSDWGRDIPVFIISNLNESDAPSGLRGMGIEGYAVKANLSNDQLDELVDKILKPAGQKDSETLESPADQSLGEPPETPVLPPMPSLSPLPENHSLTTPPAEATPEPAAAGEPEVPPLEVAPPPEIEKPEAEVPGAPSPEPTESIVAEEGNLQDAQQQQATGLPAEEKTTSDEY